MAKTRAMCMMALCAALLCVGAWIAVPFSPPITLQTFVLFCVCLLFPGKKAIAAVVLYLLLGAVGLPVFSGFSGGIGMLFGPTGGFLFGFLLTAALTVIPCNSANGKRLILLLGLLFCYLCGTLWYAALYTSFTATGLLTAASICVTPFLLPDLLKWGLAVYCVKPLKKALSRIMSA